MKAVKETRTAVAEPLVREVRVRCSIEHAFDVFTQRIDLWWPPAHRRFEASRLYLEPTVGGRFVERSSTGEEFTLGAVLECDPPHRIAYSWYPGAIQEPTHVAIRFTEEGAETRVSVVHSEGQSALGEHWPQRVELFERGWRHVLAAFSEHLAESSA